MWAKKPPTTSQVALKYSPSSRDSNGTTFITISPLHHPQTALQYSPPETVQHTLSFFVLLHIPAYHSIGLDWEGATMRLTKRYLWIWGAGLRKEKMGNLVKTVKSAQNGRYRVIVSWATNTFAHLFFLDSSARLILLPYWICGARLFVG